MPSSKGEAPICRIEGVIGIIDRYYPHKDQIYPGESWHVEITKVFDKYVTVTPLTMTKSVEENEEELRNMVGVLGEKFRQHNC